MPEARPIRCGSCATELAPEALSCPSCRALVHAAELTTLAANAAQATSEGRLADALIAWRRAQELLPSDTGQHARITATISALTKQADAAGISPPAGSSAPKWLAGLGTAGLLLWKFKFVLVFVLGKGKLLLLGLTKLSTLLSMFATLGLYWSLWGWRFALGLVVSMYIHEMGHVAALRRYGIAASAPMFIPGLGALVRLKQTLNDVREDARVGMAGPIWGLAAALTAWGVGLAAGWGSFVAIARIGAWLNLFNLLPLGSLDGGRAFRAMSRNERLIAAGVLLGAWFLTAEILLLLLGVAALGRAFVGEQRAQGDRTGLVLYTVVAALLAGIAALAATELQS